MVLLRHGVFAGMVNTPSNDYIYIYIHTHTYTYMINRLIEEMKIYSITYMYMCVCMYLLEYIESRNLCFESRDMNCYESIYRISRL